MEETDVGAQAPQAGPLSNRGFWKIFGAGLAMSAVLLVLIVANRPKMDAIAHVENGLLHAASVARGVHRQDGSWAAASAARLGSLDHTNTYGPGHLASTAPGIVSVHADDAVWAAAMANGRGACFTIRIDSAGTTYGLGTGCTGDDAVRTATDPSW